MENAKKDPADEINFFDLMCVKVVGDKSNSIFKKVKEDIRSLLIEGFNWLMAEQ